MSVGFIWLKDMDKWRADADTVMNIRLQKLLGITE